MVSAYLDGAAHACDAYDAEFVLVDIRKESVSIHYPVSVLIPWASESTLCIATTVGEFSYYYASLSHLYAYTRRLAASVGANIAGNVRAGVVATNHYDYYDMDYDLDLQFDHMDTREVCERIHQMPVSRITQDHHQYVTHHELEEVLPKVTDRRRERFLAIKEALLRAKELDFNNRVSAVTLVLYLAIAPIFAVRLVIDIIATSRGSGEFMRRLKAEGGAAKQLQTIFRDDLASVYELNVLRNRVFDTVDWDKEIHNRVEPATAPISRERVFKRAARIFQVAASEGAMPVRRRWSEYWANRIASMPNGSVVSQYPEDRRIKEQLPFDGRVKSAWFAANTKKNHKEWLERKPEIYASTSTKYEWGKTRALYGCDVTSFLHADFAMNKVEDTLPSYFPVGARASDTYVKKVLERMNYGIPFCYDYDDFNSQHSTENMVAVIDAWHMVFGHHLTDEQVESLRWTAQSVKEQYVNFNEVHRVVRVNGTLLSGWRLTSFINTVLNRVYLEEAGLAENVEYAVHNGDDMYASCATILNAMKVVRNGRRLGIRAQVSKTNIGTIGEFLRVDARARNKTSAQYLARAISTAVHGRVEIGKANDARNALMAVKTRVDAIVNRGGDTAVAKALLSAQIGFLKGLFKLDDRTAHLLIHAHPVQGGSDVNAEVQRYRLRLTYLVDENERDTLRSRFAAIKPGVHDYVEAVKRSLKLTNIRVTDSDVINLFADQLLRWKSTYETVIDGDLTRRRILRGLYKTWEDDPAIVPVSKARQIGIGTIPALRYTNSGLTTVLQTAINPMEFLAVAT